MLIKPLEPPGLPKAPRGRNNLHAKQTLHRGILSVMVLYPGTLAQQTRQNKTKYGSTHAKLQIE